MRWFLVPRAGIEPTCTAPEAVALSIRPPGQGRLRLVRSQPSLYYEIRLGADDRGRTQGTAGVAELAAAEEMPPGSALK